MATKTWSNRKVSDHVFPDLRLPISGVRETEKHWIPTFAGMTAAAMPPKERREARDDVAFPGCQVLHRFIASRQLGVQDLGKVGKAKRCGSLPSTPGSASLHPGLHSEPPPPRASTLSLY